MASNHKNKDSPFHIVSPAIPIRIYSAADCIKTFIPEG